MAEEQDWMKLLYRIPKSFVLNIYIYIKRGGNMFYCGVFTIIQDVYRKYFDAFGLKIDIFFFFFLELLP